MKIKKNTSTKKKIALVLAVLVLLGTPAYAFAASQNGLWPFINESDRSRETSDRSDRQESESDTDSIRDDQPSQDNSSNTGDGMGEPNTTAPDSRSQSSATINIPSQQASNGTITVNVAISEPWTSGECVMELSGATSRSVREPVFGQAQISGCQLQASGLPSGSYSAVVYAERNGQRTASQTLQVRL